MPAARPMTPTRPIPTTTALFALLSAPDASGHAAAALAGDSVARHYAVPDHLEEMGMNLVPFAAGEKHLIQTETLYWIGEIEAVVGGFLILKAASWVHWTGTLGTLCERLSLDKKGWPPSHQRPRSEYVGEGVIISLSKIVDSIRKDWNLPTESVRS